MRNYPEFLLAFLGITAVGGVAVPLNSLWVADELEYGVKDAECKVRQRECNGMAPVVNFFLFPGPHLRPRATGVCLPIRSEARAQDGSVPVRNFSQRQEPCDDDLGECNLNWKPLYCACGSRWRNRGQG